MRKTNFTLLFFMGFVILSFYSQAQTLTSITNFGTNPGAINAYYYIPDSMPPNAPLVLVLHGCTENANGFNSWTQWSDLADRNKFYVAYGEETLTNSVGLCWNIYLSADNTRDSGEALSLKQVTDYMKANYSIDSTRVFVTGFSAGGGMTTVMASCYPEVYAAGAEMSGLPYGCATSLVGFGVAATGGVSKTPQEWGDLSRAQNPGYTGNWPRMAIFHGSSDEVVNIENASQVIGQFTNLHNISQTPGYTNTSFNGNTVVQLEQFFDSANRVPVEYYEISNMLHGVAVYPGTCYQQGGETSIASFNVQLYAPFWAARFFGIVKPAPGLDSITGLSNVPINQQGLTYSVPYTAGSVYTWTIIPAGDSIISGQGTNSITANWGTANGTIYVTEMPTGGCELGPATLYVTATTATAAVSNITEPAVTVCLASVTPVFTLTNSGTAILTSDSIYYFVDGNAVQKYLWAGSLSPSQSDTVTLPAASVATGSHVLTIISSSPNGGVGAGVNSANDTVITTFTAGTTPVVNLGNNITQCGDSVSLDARNPGASYAWSTGAVSQSVSVSQTGTYTVTVTSSGCSASSGVNVTINTPPIVNLGSNINQCGGTAGLDAQNPGGSYAWSTGAVSQTISVSQTGTYTVTVTLNGCSDSSGVNVTINTVPVVNLGKNIIQCGGSVSLDAKNPGDTYSWSTGAVTQTISVSQTGTYSVTVASNGCSDSSGVTVTINTPPTVGLQLLSDSVCEDAEITLQGGNPSGGQFSGQDVGGGVFNASAAGAGIYPITYNYTDPNGCSASASENIVVEACTSITTVDGNIAMTIFPNPNSTGILHIQVGRLTPGLQVKIFDVMGSVAGQKYIDSENSYINISALSQGIYIISLEGNGIMMVKKLVVQK